MLVDTLSLTHTHPNTHSFADQTMLNTESLSLVVDY